MTDSIVIIVDNVRSMYNVGALFRLADGLGVSKLYLCGITAKPPRAEIHKTALGTEQHVMWEYCTTTAEAIAQLKNEGFTIAALELTETAVPLASFHPTFPLALIIGHERDGVGESELFHSDVHIQIPMQGRGISLNVTTACAIALWHIQSTKT